MICVLTFPIPGSWSITCPTPRYVQVVVAERKRYAPRDYVALSWVGSEGFSSLYRVFRTARAWEDAAAACGRDGASLAVAETHGEAVAIQVLLQKSRRTDAFVGLRRANSKSTFRTIEGVFHF